MTSRFFPTLNEMYLSYASQILKKNLRIDSRPDVLAIDKNNPNLTRGFREKVSQSAHRPNPISPPNGGRSPRTKTIFVRVHRPKICKGQVGEGSPPRGRNRKSAPPPTFLNPIFSKTVPINSSTRPHLQFVKCNTTTIC